MAAILTRIEQCKTLFVVVALLGVCLVSMACASNGSPLPKIDRDSFKVCPTEVPTDEHIQYLATGSASGTYVLLGDAIEKITSGNRDIQLRVCITEGSNENLTLLRDNKVQFALVQLDTLHAFLENETHSDNNIRLVTFLYSEKLHLFIRPHLYLNSPSELPRAGNTTDGGYRAKIWLGPPRGGGLYTASRVLEAAGISADDIDSFATTRKDLTWDRAANCLLADPKNPETKSRALSAYFRMMAVPKKSEENRKRSSNCPPEESTEPLTALSVDDLLQADAQLMPLPPALIDRLTEDGLYVRTSIDLGNYRYLKRGVPTVGIPTVLLTNLRKDDRDSVEALISHIEHNRARIEEHIDGIELDQFYRVQEIDFLLPHAGAEEHLQPNSSRFLWFCLFIFVLLVVGGWLNPLSLRRGLAAGSYFWILSLSLGAVWFLLSLVMMQVEGRLNPDFLTLSGSLMTTLGVVTGRLRDYQLMTPEAEIWSWLGLFVFPVIVGWLLSDVVKELFRRSAVRLARVIRRAQARDAHRALIGLATLLKRLLEWPLGKSGSTEPLVFINWNSRAEQMVNEIRQNVALADQPIIVVRPEGSEPKTGDPLRKLSVVDGDPTARETLERAGIAEASAVTILSAWGPADPRDRRRSVDPESADSKTILAILAIRVLCEDRHRSRELPISAEIRLTRNQREAADAVREGRQKLTCLAV